MTVKLRFALLVLAFLAPAVLGASPAPPAAACSSTSSATLLTEILSPGSQPSAVAPERLSPLDKARSTTCSAADCAVQCDPCACWNFYGCVNGEAVCRCHCLHCAG
jgi:hypothetical protein